MIQTGAPEETGMGPLPFSADYSAISPHGIANTRLAGLGTWEAQRQAYARFYAMVLSQTQALAYIDTFWWLTLGAALMLGLAFVLKRNDPRESGTVSVH